LLRVQELAGCEVHHGELADAHGRGRRAGGAAGARPDLEDVHGLLVDGRLEVDQWCEAIGSVGFEEEAALPAVGPGRLPDADVEEAADVSESGGLVPVPPGTAASAGSSR
jgi:hypothetical protein